MKDYCSHFPDTFRNKFIGDCCQKHDNDCGEAGGFCFMSHQVKFYKCLRTKLNMGWSGTIAVGGAVLCAIKYPWFVIKKIMYRIGEDKEMEGY